MKYLIAIVCSFVFFAGSHVQACPIGVQCGVQQVQYAQSFAVQQYAVQSFVPVQTVQYTQVAAVAYSPVVVQQAVVNDYCASAVVARQRIRPIRAAVRVATAPVRVVRQRAVVQKQVIRQRVVAY